MTNHDARLRRIDIINSADAPNRNICREMMIHLSTGGSIDDAGQIAADFEGHPDNAYELAELLTPLFIACTDAYDSTAREGLTRLALDLSLCPLHFIDYAICFDDNDADCASIRIVHPAHDS